MRIENVSIPARDGFPLAALHFVPGSIAPKAAVQFNCGTGVKKEFYSDFASFLAHNGYAVVVYDYRGIGASVSGSLSDMQARLSDWGELDMAGVLDWLSGLYPESHRFVVSHSMGGQLIGLMENYALINGIVTIATGSGYWRVHPFPFRYFPLFMWSVYIPIVTLLFGYAPLKAVKSGEDLPENVARQWARWCTNKRYMRSEFGKTLRRIYFDQITVPIQSYIFDDDPITTKDNGRGFITSYYKNSSQIGFEEIPAKSSPNGVLGHFGFFRKKIGHELWKLPLAWLDKQVAQLNALKNSGHVAHLSN